MGMFDSVMLRCPKCGEEHEAQTKSGSCILALYDFPGDGPRPAPDDVMQDVNRHGPFHCECGTVFEVEEIDPPPPPVRKYRMKILEGDNGS